MWHLKRKVHTKMKWTLWKFMSLFSIICRIVATAAYNQHSSSTVLQFFFLRKWQMESNWSRRLFEGFHLCEKDRWAWTTQNSSFHIFPFISPSFLMSDDDGQKNCSKICLELYNCCCIVGNLIFYIILELLQIGTVQNSKNILPRKLIPTSIHLDFSTLKKEHFTTTWLKWIVLGQWKIR